MPVNTTYPGVYIEELPSGVRTVVSVGTSTTAFVGYTARGLDHRPTTLFGFADFERAFGGLDSESLLSYAVWQYFVNGGNEAVVSRVPKSDAVASAVTLLDDADGDAELVVTALSAGSWANAVVIDVDHDVPAGDVRAYNLTITDLTTGTIERFVNVSNNTGLPNAVTAVVNDPASGSQLVSVAVAAASTSRPHPTGLRGATVDPSTDLGLEGRSITVTVALSDTDSVVIATDLILPAGQSQPASLSGLCNLVETAVNSAVPASQPGIRVSCVPDGTGIRMTARIDVAHDRRVDAPLTVTPGTVGASGAGTLGLTAGSVRSANVSHYLLGLGREILGQASAIVGDNGTTLPGGTEIVGSPAAFTGIHALEKVDLFNLLCLPDLTRATDGAPNTPALTDGELTTALASALELCERRRAMLMVDPPPNVANQSSALDWISDRLSPKDANAVAYFPRVRVADPLDNFRLRSIPPCGTVAGLIARVDGERGVWKAPAGTAASLRGVSRLEYELSDDENGQLNPLGLNCLRTKPVFGSIVWGSRTLDGADVAASQWKYVPVRRLALMIEETLFRSTQWAVFEPNDEDLWAQLRLSVESFMHDLFRQGAFQGTKPSETYLVKIDSQTTTQHDIDRGRVNIVVGFAPLKPAEFVIIQIKQLAGESAS